MCWAFGATTQKLTKENMTLKLADHWYSSSRAGKDQNAKMLEFAKQSLVKFERGETPYLKMKEWDVQARVMRLNDKACMNCHTESKLNDPVAVFVFATKPKETD